MSNYLISGAAGFIAFRVAELLLEDGHAVYGVDNLNDAYDVRLKDYRLSRLKDFPEFHFMRMDISEKDSIDTIGDWLPEKVDGVINLAARAGVRTSLTDPWVYVNTNMVGTLNLLELCRRFDIFSQSNCILNYFFITRHIKIKHLVSSFQIEFLWSIILKIFS